MSPFDQGARDALALLLKLAIAIPVGVCLLGLAVSLVALCIKQGNHHGR